MVGRHMFENGDVHHTTASEPHLVPLVKLDAGHGHPLVGQAGTHRRWARALAVGQVNLPVLDRFLLVDCGQGTPMAHVAAVGRHDAR